MKYSLLFLFSYLSLLLPEGYFHQEPLSSISQLDITEADWGGKVYTLWQHLPRTVRKALEVLMGMVKSEHVYRPSSESATSVMLMVSSFHEARTSSIRLSLSATTDRQTNANESHWPISQYIVPRTVQQFNVLNSCRIGFKTLASYGDVQELAILILQTQSANYILNADIYVLLLFVNWTQYFRSLHDLKRKTL